MIMCFMKQNQQNALVLRWLLTTHIQAGTALGANEVPFGHEDETRLLPAWEMLCGGHDVEMSWQLQLQCDINSIILNIYYMYYESAIIIDKLI